MKITVRNLSFAYPECKNIIDGVSFDIEDGEYVVLCGRSGSGKTTLLRLLKPETAPFGKKSGEIKFDGTEISSMSSRMSAEKTGFVTQNPDNRIVTDKVWHEMAFGLENLGKESSVIRQKTAEMAEYFGSSDLFMRDVNTLSGGQKQLLNLASVMATEPEILILDEPVSQLDPIAASDFLHAVSRLNKELGVTVIITEHRLEDIFSEADRIMILDGGKIVADGNCEYIGKRKDLPEFMATALPTPMRIFSAVNDDGLDKANNKCAVTVRDGRNRLKNMLPEPSVKKLETASDDDGETVLKMKNILFGYNKKDDPVFESLNVKFQKGKITAVMGGNGAGKSTLLKLIAGTEKPVYGKIKKSDKTMKISYIPQKVDTVFTENTVEKDLLRISKNIDEAVRITDIGDVLKKNPFDLSGGEMQRAAVAKLLLTEPDIILLDEPTKGMDGEYKRQFGDILMKLKNGGKTVIMVSHDVEFCALNADICMMLFGGSIVSEKPAREFFIENSFYTTAARRMTKGIFENAVTDDDVVSLIRCNTGGGAIE